MPHISLHAPNKNNSLTHADTHSLPQAVASSPDAGARRTATPTRQLGADANPGRGGVAPMRLALGADTCGGVVEPTKVLRSSVVARWHRLWWASSWVPSWRLAGVRVGHGAFGGCWVSAVDGGYHCGKTAHGYSVHHCWRGATEPTEARRGRWMLGRPHVVKPPPPPRFIHSADT